ncbi:hypothetical protein [Nonomuraea roseoviolacea]|uniref:Formate hydrogenlyase subunit 3/multisubunit Na+/H+ antiporter MnhD subunit n=1 Tax=Nonomuraea roseoviolacea subsp. carminata TaxID=160689 RepID=A0ABT1KC97_9ACTN|nr:hypothetical protein [Nonomuraea roseoviolacea]MCP2351217.1 formate hydrogenlyase subunit 3/multisubunit Na+/H+ antiporter MnhD subunit [Nonomuraea roseoviolacea subsp. carminata]
MTSFETVPLFAAWGIALVCGAAFVTIFARLMPTRALKWQIVLAALVGTGAVALLGALKHWPVREMLAYFSVVTLSLALASLGQGSDIRLWATGGDTRSGQPGQMKFTIKLVAILAALLVLKAALLPS